MNRICTGLHKLKERCRKALTGISQMERFYRVITTVINLHDAQSITKDSARLCPHTLCLCMTPRGLWWRHSHGAVGLGMGGGSAAQDVQRSRGPGFPHGVAPLEALLRGLARQELRVAQKPTPGSSTKRTEDKSRGLKTIP